MPVWLHANLTALSILVGTFGSIIGLAVYGEALRINQLQGTPGKVVLLAIIVSGALAPWLLFKHLIPAKCGNCGGRTRMVRSRRIKYRCRSCGHRQRSGVWLGNSR